MCLEVAWTAEHLYDLSPQSDEYVSRISLFLFFNASDSWSCVLRSNVDLRSSPTMIVGCLGAFHHRMHRRQQFRLVNRQQHHQQLLSCLLYTSPSPRDR